MGNGLLKYALFIESQSDPGLFLKITCKNSKKDAAASRIVIR